MRLCVVSHKECCQDEAGIWCATGGFPLQMQSLCALFDEATLLLVPGPPRQGGMPLPQSARVVPLRPPGQSLAQRRFSLTLRLPSYLKRMVFHMRKADVVHVPLPGDISFLATMVALALRKRVLARYCGSWGITADTPLTYRATQTLMRKAAGGRNVMLATGAGSAPPAPNIHWVFATAISAREIAEVQPDVDRGRNNPPRLVYVGRLAPGKGLRDLIQAMSVLRDETKGTGRSPRLTIIGDGPLRLELAALVKIHHCDDVVHFTGQLNRRDLFPHLLEADVCVLPSLSEGFPKSRLEAMLCGVPIITTHAGFGREIAGVDGERGWLVPPGSATALVDCIREVLANPLDWPALRKRCRTFAEKHTLEIWSRHIGEICARQWHLKLTEGRLRA